MPKFSIIIYERLHMVNKDFLPKVKTFFIFLRDIWYSCMREFLKQTACPIPSEIMRIQNHEEGCLQELRRRYD